MKTHHTPTSSAVTSLDHHDGECTVHYKKGGSYTFPATEAHFEALTRADSIGKALHAHLTGHGLTPKKKTA